MIQSDRMVILVEVIGFWIGLIWDFPNKKADFIGFHDMFLWKPCVRLPEGIF